MEGSWYSMLVVTEGNASVKEPSGNEIQMKITYEDFGEAFEEITEATGETNYGVQFVTSVAGEDYTELGVVYEDGKKIMTKGLMGVCKLEWITPEEAEALENEGDPVDAPSCPYELQPDSLGKLVWITGPPCSGKSGTAQMLAKNDGFVWFEADCFEMCKNPYIPLDAEDPSMAMWTQKNLKGDGVKERAEIGKKAGEICTKREEDEEAYNEIMKEYYEMLCDDIANERKRIGGDWVITHAAPNPFVRNVIRFQNDKNLSWF